jgi:hypothetical protein
VPSVSVRAGPRLGGGDEVVGGPRLSACADLARGGSGITRYGDPSLGTAAGLVGGRCHDSDAGEAAAALVHAEILLAQPDRRLRVHPLVEQAVYGDITPVERFAGRPRLIAVRGKVIGLAPW